MHYSSTALALRIQIVALDISAFSYHINIPPSGPPLMQVCNCFSSAQLATWAAQRVLLSNICTPCILDRHHRGFAVGGKLLAIGLLSPLSPICDRSALSLATWRLASARVRHGEPKCFYRSAAPVSCMCSVGLDFSLIGFEAFLPRFSGSTSLCFKPVHVYGSGRTSLFTMMP